MSSEQIQLLIDKIKSKFANADLSVFPDKFAIQINLTGKIESVLYIEVLHGVLNVMPYEYIDRDAAINITKTNLEKFLDGKLKFETAYKDGKLTVEGDYDKAAMLKNFL